MSTILANDITTDALHYGWHAAYDAETFGIPAVVILRSDAEIAADPTYALAFNAGVERYVSGLDALGMMTS